MKLPGKGKNRYNELLEFAEQLIEIDEEIDFKQSSRGWCYQLEGYQLVVKSQFNRVQNLINECRKNGMIPINFVAEEAARTFHNITHPDTETPQEYIQSWIESTLDCKNIFTPDYWNDEKYYIQMLVEKVDLVSLFKPVCKEYFIPIATCFDSETEILTNTGWKYFVDLNYLDKVATMDNNGMLVFQEPIKIINQSYKGKMYHIKNRATDQLITPNHNVYVRSHRYNRNNTQFGTKRIENIAHLNNLKFKKNILWNGNEVIHFKLPSITPCGGPNIIKEKLDMDTWLQFFGYYISEGNINHKPKHDIYIVQLAQKRDKHPEVYEKMRECVAKLGYNFYADYQSIQISNKQLYSYLKQFGKCNTKYIPRELLELSPRQSKILLKALIEGDGHKRTTRAVYITTSKQLANDVQELALKAGHYASVSLRPTSCGVIKGRNIKSMHQCYSVNISTARDEFLVNHNKNDCNIVEYNGTIHCVEVKNGLIYVRRNGKPVWSGNSKGWSSILQRAEIALRFKEMEVLGNTPVLLYCGDFDLAGIAISDNLYKNFIDIEFGTGWSPENLIIDRFGLNYDFIIDAGLSLINNLETQGGYVAKVEDGYIVQGRTKSGRPHPDFNKPATQEYLMKYGVVKCEANALVSNSVAGRQLCRDTIEKYLGVDALDRFAAKKQVIVNRFEKMEDELGIVEPLTEALELLDNLDTDETV